MAILTRLGVPGQTEAWSQLGFSIDDGDRTTIGGVIHEFGSEPSWSFDALASDTDLGVPTTERPAAADTPIHPNGITRMDHVVYAVPAIDPAVDALTAVLGEPPRRRARPRGPDGPEMAFFRCGNGFIECVAAPVLDRPAIFGIAYACDDLDATVGAIRAAGGPVGDPKPAVQGGRIASVWKGHVGFGIAIMEPPNHKERADG